MPTRGTLAALIFLQLFSAFLSAQSRATVRDSGAGLLRSPRIGSDVLKRLPEGVEVEVEDLYTDREWTRVTVGENHGWVQRKTIKVRMDDPWRSAAWLFIGSTPKTNGFIVRFYLNTSQIVKYGENVRFWTKMVPDKKKAYFNFVMETPPSRKPEDFRFNSELWEGDCKSGDLRLIRSILYWKASEVTRPQISRDDRKAEKNTAAKVILQEACRSALR